MAYNNTYEEFINSLDKKFDNETMLERYYLYVKELFESYVKILNIINKDKSEEKEKNAIIIISNIKDYIKIFTEKSSGYLFNLLDIFKNTPEEYFFEIVIFTIGDINKCGKKCLEDAKEFCRYNSLMYFERAVLVFNKYIINISNIPIYPLELRKKCKDELGISLPYINDIKTGAILLLEDSIKTGKLISKTGFTNFEIGLGLKFTKKEENIKNEIILQNYEKMLRELNQNLDPSNKILLPYKPNIKKAICIANIVKISFKFLGKTNFKRLIELCDTCQNIVNELDKNDEKWYQEFETISDEINSAYSTLEEYLIDLREKIKNKYKADFDELQNKFNKKKNNREFIEFVLDKYPYEDYEDDKKLNKIDFSKEQELLLYLSSKYHPDQYKYMNEEEQIQKLHFIAELIDSLLNNMYNTIQ